MSPLTHRSSSWGSTSWGRHRSWQDVSCCRLGSSCCRSGSWGLSGWLEHRGRRALWWRHCCWAELRPRWTQEEVAQSRNPGGRRIGHPQLPWDVREGLEDLRVRVLREGPAGFGIVVWRLYSLGFLFTHWNFAHPLFPMYQTSVEKMFCILTNILIWLLFMSFAHTFCCVMRQYLWSNFSCDPTSSWRSHWSRQSYVSFFSRRPDRSRRSLNHKEPLASNMRN